VPVPWLSHHNRIESVTDQSPEQCHALPWHYLPPSGHIYFSWGFVASPRTSLYKLNHPCFNMFWYYEEEDRGRWKT